MARQVFLPTLIRQVTVDQPLKTFQDAASEFGFEVWPDPVYSVLDRDEVRAVKSETTKPLYHDFIDLVNKIPSTTEELASSAVRIREYKDVFHLEILLEDNQNTFRERQIVENFILNAGNRNRLPNRYINRAPKTNIGKIESIKLPEPVDRIKSALSQVLPSIIAVEPLPLLRSLD